MTTIDVDEILQSSSQPPEKRARANPLITLSTANASASEILAALQGENDSQQGTDVDENIVKKVSLNLEKKQLKNREMRIKYADEPTKFMESEVELNTAIQELHIVTTQPEMYEVLVEMGVVQLLLQLLSHENTDIGAAVCNLIQELTDVDTLNESQKGAAVLVDELLKFHVVETLVQQVLQRMNEEIQDESDAVQNALSIVENLLDFRPVETGEICVEQGLFQWLLSRATTRKRAFDANKLYASQLLHTLLQSTEEARKALVTEKLDGVDLLLRALAVYKRNDPGSGDEFEHMENLFDSLCASLLHLPNRQTFLDGEGLQLMNLMLKEKKQSASGALKTLSYAMAFPGGGPNCDKFVEVLGLRMLFPLFMRTPPRVKRKDTTPDEHEEHVCSVIDALLSQCSEENKQRVLQKFAEHGFENVDRAIELLISYSERVKRFVQKQLSKTPGFAEIEPEELYIEKLNNGLYTLERVALIIAEVCVHGHVGCRERTAKLFRMKLKNSSISAHLDPILRDIHSNLGDNADAQRQRLETLLIRLVDISQAEGVTHAVV